MKKQQHMITLVQTLCIIRDIQDGRGMAAQVIEPIMWLHPMFFEEYFVKDEYNEQLSFAAKQYVDYQYGDGKQPEKPEWYEKAEQWRGNPLR